MVAIIIINNPKAISKINLRTKVQRWGCCGENRLENQENVLQNVLPSSATVACTVTSLGLSVLIWK